MAGYTKDFYTNLQEGSLRSASKIIPLVQEYLEIKKVIDVGCGVGCWLAVFKQLGAEKIVGVDGDYVDRRQLQIPKKAFIPFDLTKAFHLKEQFDLVVSLEVAEHLPPNSAETFIETLTSLGPVILFSAAVPFQRGEHHVNLQWPEYWAKLFKKRGYEIVDCLRKRVWQDSEVEWWYAQNIFLYVNRDQLNNYPKLVKELKYTYPTQLSIIHPRHYLSLRERSD